MRETETRVTVGHRLAEKLVEAGWIRSAEIVNHPYGRWHVAEVVSTVEEISGEKVTL